MPETKHTLQLHLICYNLPPTTFNGIAASQFGLQNKKGVLDLGASQADGSRLFTCSVEAKWSDDTLDFSGTVVQGNKGSRFLYLSWAYDTGGWVQRIKVLLAGITLEHIRSGNLLEAVIEDGCASATVKLKYGWKTV